MHAWKMHEGYLDFEDALQAVDLTGLRRSSTAELGFSRPGIRIEAAIQRAQGAAYVLDKAGHR
jgi:hypothetical protein